MENLINRINLKKSHEPVQNLPGVLIFISTAGYAHNGINYTDSLPPVETKSPNSNYKPAFGGQTRIAGVKTTTPYKVEKISEKLGPPFAIVAMPDGRLMM